MTIKEKLQIIRFYDENRGLSVRKIASAVTSKLNRTVCRATVQNIIKKREDILNSSNKNLDAVRVKSTIELKFEQLLGQKLDESFANTTVPYNLGQCLAQQIQQQPQFHGTCIEKYKFCHVWWSKFCKNRAGGHNSQHKLTH